MGDHRREQALETIRFGEYLREQRLLTDEQLLEALAAHWSRRDGTIGRAIVERGFLSYEEVERQARLYHGLDVVEIEA